MIRGDTTGTRENANSSATAARNEEEKKRETNRPEELRHDHKPTPADAGPVCACTPPTHISTRLSGKSPPLTPLNRDGGVRETARERRDIRTDERPAS